jgi:hypothetical protein
MRSAACLIRKTETHNSKTTDYRWAFARQIKQAVKTARPNKRKLENRKLVLAPRITEGFSPRLSLSVAVCPKHIAYPWLPQVLFLREGNSEDCTTQTGTSPFEGPWPVTPYNEADYDLKKQPKQGHCQRPGQRDGQGSETGNQLGTDLRRGTHIIGRNCP